MNITQQTQSWGNSTGIRLPKKVLKAAQWQSKQEVSIDVDGADIILRPVKAAHRRRMSLDEMLEGVTPDKIGGEMDLGSDVGKERWYD